MKNKSAFKNSLRETLPERLPLERIKDWHEFKELLPEERIKQQAGRCLDCGTPFCHTGMDFDGVNSGCPLNNLIPEWNHLVYRGLWKEALNRLSRTNNFPEFTGRVCPALCEGSCTAELSSSSVTVRNIELAIVEKGFAEGWIVPNPPQKRSGKKVAVVGSGPAGLACSQQLNKAGHEVTVFEKQHQIGGLLVYGVPNMKLDKKVVKRRVNILVQEGVQFITGVEVGQDYSPEKLLARYDAVVLCCGALEPRELAVEGRYLKGIYNAMEFLHSSTGRLLPPYIGRDKYISAKGKDVIVIGGGDTATDCLATALRQGCKSVNQFIRKPQLVANREATNPWPQYPLVERSDYGHKEAQALYSRDPRYYNTVVKRLIGDEEGYVKKIETVQVEWECDSKGNQVSREVKGSKKVWPTQLVLLALGFIGPQKSLLEGFGLLPGKISKDKYFSGVDGIFVAGDMRRGQSLVAWAIKEGREAAKVVPGTT